jgi:hypothetical protein
VYVPNRAAVAGSCCLPPAAGAGLALERQRRGGEAAGGRAEGGGAGHGSHGALHGPAGAEWLVVVAVGSPFVFVGDILFQGRELACGVVGLWPSAHGPRGRARLALAECCLRHTILIGR